MTENEVLKDLKKYQGILKAKVRINASVNPEIALDSTTEAIELIEQYRAIGTVEELETAMNIVSDMGTYKGQTLGNIYNLTPRNLVYLATHSSTVGKYARVIIATDEALSKMLKDAEEV